MIKLLAALLLFTFQSLCATHYILMGAPGSGKGMFTYYLKQHGDFEHLCAGDLLREEIEKETEIGQIVKSIVARGDLVPTDIWFPFFESKFAHALSEGKQVIVDGVVQSQENVNFLNSLIVKYQIDQDCRFVYLKIDRNLAEDRLLSRRVCDSCGRIYSAKEKIAQCTYCSGAIVKRMDDTNTTINKRLNRFFGSTIYLVDQFRESPFFYEFDGSVSIQEAFQQYAVYFPEGN